MKMPPNKDKSFVLQEKPLIKPQESSACSSHHKFLNLIWVTDQKNPLISSINHLGESLYSIDQGRLRG